MKKLFTWIFVGVALSGVTKLLAQTESEVPAWDQQFFFGNKVSWGSENWKYSGELQIRLKDYGKALDNWYLEGVAAYMPSKKWEIVPDFRLGIHPEGVEYRPGFGVLRKDLFRKGEGRGHQIVNQLKYQVDFLPGEISSGLRYILFYNYVASEKIILSGIGGVFYSWKDHFTGLEYIRGGAGAAYVFNKQHALNLIYFVGAANLGDSWSYQGNFLVQLVINIVKDYKYLPAKYISF